MSVYLLLNKEKIVAYKAMVATMTMNHQQALTTSDNAALVRLQDIKPIIPIVALIAVDYYASKQILEYIVNECIPPHTSGGLIECAQMLPCFTPTSCDQLIDVGTRLVDACNRYAKDLVNMGEESTLESAKKSIVNAWTRPLQRLLKAR